MKSSGTIFKIFLLCLTQVYPQNTNTQYFGRNKPGYKSFEFEVTQTSNFEIYHYLEDDTLLNDFSQWAEEWYTMHQKIFRDTFENKNPIILYSTHSDFQQTNAVTSIIGSGTGGVTEGLKKRVIMPVAPTLSQTDHVLGHELVHAFQFNMLVHSDSSAHYSLSNIPLWMIEGMAEYLSIGSSDPNTAMWMRDALLNDDFPTLRQLSINPEYFPYRYGHAFWAMVGKTWGDTVIIPLFDKTAKKGLNPAVKSVLGVDSKTLSGMWKSTMETHYKKYLKDSTDSIIGEKVITKKNAGRINISPSLSPDGNFLAFFSEKDVFTLDLYLASVKTGKIIKKLSSVTRNHEIDDFSFIESGGTWSPDSKKFAFVIFSKGKNKIAIVDIKHAKIIDEIELIEVTSLSNPEWSPDGKSIVFTGLVDGISDLYMYNFKTKSTKKLTDDYYSNIHPAWSPDGNYITYSTETKNKGNSKKYGFKIQVMDIRTNDIKTLDVFQGADNLNPRFSNNGQTIYFLSDADGYRNMYKFDMNTNRVYRLTQYMTGISGITPYSPAISTSRTSGLVAYTYYFNKNYQIITANNDEFKPVYVENPVANFEPGTLPPLEHASYNIIDKSLYSRNNQINNIQADSLKEKPYRPKFKLDYISNNIGIGISTGRYTGSSMAGSIWMIFSDMVGNNQLYSALSLTGEIYDFGGQVAYVNRTGKIKWGALVSHIPYRSGNVYLKPDTLDLDGEKLPVRNFVFDFLRTFEDNVSLFTFYPFSQTRRLEAGVSFSWYYYRFERYNNYYNDFGYRLGVKKEIIDVPKGNNYQKLDLAYVEDNSYFGLTSPMRGHRSRYQIEKYFGVVDFGAVLFDYRKYFFIKPFSLAFRFYHYGRYGKGAESEMLSPLYIGYPWFIRGYGDVSTFTGDYINSGAINISHLSGSKIIVSNAELRLPLTGPKRLALIKSLRFFIDINLFFDSGLAINKGETVNFNWELTSYDEKIPVFSAGTSLRFNLYGYLIIEPFYAFPFQNGGWQNGTFGLNFLPGW